MIRTVSVVEGLTVELLYEGRSVQKRRLVVYRGKWSGRENSGRGRTGMMSVRGPKGRWRTDKEDRRNG